jgi:NitT/TauT family transport system substrate-binding protein
MKFRWPTTASLLLALALLAACGGAAPAATQPTAAPAAPAAEPTTAPAAEPTSLTKLRTGFIPVVIFAPLFVGIERGYFQDEGIEIELTPIQSGNEAVVQLAANNFDVSLGGANAGLFNAAARGVKFTVVAPLHSEKPPVVTPMIISAKRTGEITSIADLKGKKVAVNAVGAGTEYWLAQALAKGGLTMQDIELVAMPFPQIPAALENGSLDAAVVTEPIVTSAKDQGLVSILADDFINGFTATYVYMGDALVSKPELAQAFMRAYLRACRDLQGEYMTDEVATIIEKYTKVPAAVLKRIPTPQYNPDGTVPVQDLQALETYFRERGLLEYDTPLDVSTIVNTQIAADAAKSISK